MEKFWWKLASFLFWFGLYTLCITKYPNKAPEWASRAITMVHGTVASIAGVWLCGIPSISECTLTAQIGTEHYALMLWSWGYFAFDMLWCLVFWPDHFLMLGHHASSLYGINMFIGKKNSGCRFPCTLALLEFSNPPLQIRWFLRHEGYDKNRLFLIIEVIYLIEFLFLRGVLGSYLTYKIMLSDIFGTDEKLMTLILYIVSVGFIYEILGFVFYKYKAQISEVRQAFIEDLQNL